MINTTQHGTTAKSTRTARKTTRKTKSAKPLSRGEQLVALLEKLSFTPPPGYDWKEDREQYLREKYENLR